MGSGTRPESRVRKAPGGVSRDGRPTVGCPQSGVLAASVDDSNPERESSGRLRLTRTALQLVTDEKTVVATARPGPDTQLIRSCINDGLSYEGMAEERAGQWVIVFREV